MNTMKMQADVMCNALTTLKGSLVLMKKGIMGPVSPEQEKFLAVSLEALEKLIEIHDRSLLNSRPSPTRQLLMPRLSLTSVRV